MKKKISNGYLEKQPKKCYSPEIYSYFVCLVLYSSPLYKFDSSNSCQQICPGQRHGFTEYFNFSQNPKEHEVLPADNINCFRFYQRLQAPSGL